MASVCLRLEGEGLDSRGTGEGLGAAELSPLGLWCLVMFTGKWPSNIGTPTCMENFGQLLYAVQALPCVRTLRNKMVCQPYKQCGGCSFGSWLSGFLVNGDLSVLREG